ncbi:RNA-binding S4 domain-containing protein [Sphingopyxis sp.]|uniref:RNA-binding S4 domain-containing protein n=1 Tax=Sphingopyxis sp. TaxID=1908224 RepID=UPI0035B38AB8
MASPGAAGSIRLDKLLWYLRFARSRSIAQAMVAAGHIRLDGRRVTRASVAVHAGATLVLPVGERIEVIRLLSLPLRRGPAPEAQACYARLDGGVPAPSGAASS